MLHVLQAEGIFSFFVLSLLQSIKVVYCLWHAVVAWHCQLFSCSCTVPYMLKSCTAGDAGRPSVRISFGTETGTYLTASAVPLNSE